MTAKVRIEFITLTGVGDAAGQAFDEPKGVFGAYVYTVTGGPVLSDPAPAFGATMGNVLTAGFARIVALNGVVDVAVGGADVTASEGLGVRVVPGAPLMLEIQTGQYVSIIEAADALAAQPVTDVAALSALANILTAIQAGVAVTGPLTNAQLAAAGLSTAANQGTANTSLAGILTALQGALSVTGPLTNAQLAAAGLSTAANQGTANASLASILAALQGTLDVVAHPLRVEATNRSSTIAAAATAQDLMAANAARKGWRVQNQSAGDLYVRSKGAAGSTLATADQNSFKIEAGATWTEDAHVSLYALSIIGAAAGQAFFAEEW